jgi:phenylacetate-CoA ligase
VTTALQVHGAARVRGATVIPADNRSGNMPYSRVIRLLRELPVTVTWCLPTEALIWAYLIKQRGMNPATDFPHLRALVVAGEVLSPAKKTALERIWGGKQIIEDYGSTETGSLGGECRHGNLHTWSDRVFFETCGTSGAVTEGEGSLVVTPLFREAMPLVRYDMEDQVRLGARCTCGSDRTRIEILGRKSQFVATPAGGFYPKDLENCVYSTGGEVWFWRARMRGPKAEVEVCGPGVSEQRLTERLREILNVQAQVRLVPASRFVNENWLADEPVMQKPRFVFSADEDWNKSLTYF